MKSAGESNKNRGQKPIYLDTNLQIFFCISLAAVLAVAVITPAFPKIMQELNISPQDVGLLISVFAFPGVILTPVLGVLADRFGRKRILVPSLILFGIAGGACAFARDFNLLLVLRFIQGIGFPPLFFLTTTIIGDIYSGKECTVAMGYNISVLSIGAAIYPVIGGALAMFGWYYPFILFFMAIPVGLLVLFSLKNPEPKKEQHLKEYLSSAWQTIKNRHAVGLFVASTVTFIILLGAYFTFLPLLIGDSLGASPLIIGLVVASMSLIAAFTSSQIGKLSKIYSERNLLKAAFILYALALVIIPFVSDLWLLLISTIIFGIAHGINSAIRETLLAWSAPMIHRAAFMSANQMALSLGQTSGPLIMGAIFGIWGIGSVFYASAGFSIATFTFLVIMIK